MSNERETMLKDLLTSPGWLLFKEEARKQWGPEGYGRKVSQAIANHTGTAALSQAVEIVHATAQEVNALVKWPEDEIKKLQPKPEVTVAWHRGGR